MAKHNLLKKLSIGIASLTLICPLAMSGLNNTNVNASSRYYFNNLKNPNNPVERVFNRRGWTTGPMFDYTGSHITFHGRRYTVHGTSDVGGYISLDKSRHHARKAHRARRFRRTTRVKRAKKITRRRGHRSKRARKVHRKYKRVARKHRTRRARFNSRYARRVTRKARKSHYSGWSKKEFQQKVHQEEQRIQRNIQQRVRAHEAQQKKRTQPVEQNDSTNVNSTDPNRLARAFKRYSTRFYNNHINSSMIFRSGFDDGESGIDWDYNVHIQRNKANTEAYPMGWILGNVRINKDFYNINSVNDDLKHASQSDYQKSINTWNSGVDYLNSNPQANTIYYNTNDGTWNNGATDMYNQAND